jgi:hypothetical protein
MQGYNLRAGFEENAQTHIPANFSIFKQGISLILDNYLWKF